MFFRSLPDRKLSCIFQGCVEGRITLLFSAMRGEKYVVALRAH